MTKEYIRPMYTTAEKRATASLISHEKPWPHGMPETVRLFQALQGSKCMLFTVLEQTNYPCTGAVTSASRQPPEIPESGLLGLVNIDSAAVKQLAQRTSSCISINCVQSCTSLVSKHVEACHQVQASFSSRCKLWKTWNL